MVGSGAARRSQVRAGRRASARGGARVGRPRYEDLDDQLRIFDAYPERLEGAAMIFKAPPQLGQRSMSMSASFIYASELGDAPNSECYRDRSVR